MPDSPKMDLLLAKAKLISNGGNSSGIKELRRGKKNPVQVQKKRPCSPRVSAEGGSGGAAGAADRDSPAAPDAAHGEAAVPPEPMKDHGGAEIHLQPMEEPTVELVGA
ncbi:hypothetical protein HGM15179_009676 [Zosterops borbonicus]|uniref:Uncharacterized protein n=1 Tax=Zosterops borbonicus TaxID=364589 RepID=A0A8K1GFZ3_9PASS|nr:hypothetical protein HGM15179_009676 [Zosterops borbonicus]